MQFEEEKERRMKSEHSLRDLWDHQTPTYVLWESQETREREKEYLKN